MGILLPSPAVAIVIDRWSLPMTFQHVDGEITRLEPTDDGRYQIDRKRPDKGDEWWDDGTHDDLQTALIMLADQQGWTAQTEGKPTSIIDHVTNQVPESKVESEHVMKLFLGGDGGLRIGGRESLPVQLERYDDMRVQYREEGESDYADSDAEIVENDENEKIVRFPKSDQYPAMESALRMKVEYAWTDGRKEVGGTEVVTDLDQGLLYIGSLLDIGVMIDGELTSLTEKAAQQLSNYQ